jgi:RNA polymerase sigma factor (sigma-70 family)
MKKETDRGRKPGGTTDGEEFASRLFEAGFRLRLMLAALLTLPRALRGKADDVVIEGLEKAFERHTQYRGSTGEEFFAWVLRIVQNHARDLWRAERRRPQEVSLPTIATPDAPLTDGDELPDNPEDLPARAAVEKESESPRLAALKEALGELSPEDRDLLLLRYGYEFTLKEIASLLCTPGEPLGVSAVFKRQCRAIERLRALGADLGLVQTGQRPRRRRAA